MCFFDEEKTMALRHNNDDELCVQAHRDHSDHCFIFPD